MVHKAAIAAEIEMEMISWSRLVFKSVMCSKDKENNVE
jgi:hypothetical protein